VETLVCFPTHSTTQHSFKVVPVRRFVRRSALLIGSLGLQGNHHTIVPYWNNYSSESSHSVFNAAVPIISIAFSPQPYTKFNPEIRRLSTSSLSPRQITVPPPSPSSSSVATPDETSSYFNFSFPDAPPSTPSIAVSDVMKPNSTLLTQTGTSVPANGDTSCDEFSTTRSDVTRDEFLSPSTEVHFAEFYSIPSHSSVYLTPVPYVQRGFGYRDKRARGRDSRRRRTRAKP
jgi:hypothetical protein